MHSTVLKWIECDNEANESWINDPDAGLWYSGWEMHDRIDNKALQLINFFQYLDKTINQYSHMHSKYWFRYIILKSYETLGTYLHIETVAPLITHAPLWLQTRGITTDMLVACANKLRPSLKTATISAWIELLKKDWWWMFCSEIDLNHIYERAIQQKDEHGWAYLCEYLSWRGIFPMQWVDEKSIDSVFASYDYLPLHDDSHLDASSHHITSAVWWWMRLHALNWYLQREKSNPDQWTWNLEQQECTIKLTYRTIHTQFLSGWSTIMRPLNTSELNVEMEPFFALMDVEDIHNHNNILAWMIALICTEEGDFAHWLYKEIQKSIPAQSPWFAMVEQLRLWVVIFPISSHTSTSGWWWSQWTMWLKNQEFLSKHMEFVHAIENEQWELDIAEERNVPIRKDKREEYGQHAWKT